MRRAGFCWLLLPIRVPGSFVAWELAPGRPNDPAGVVVLDGAAFPMLASHG